MSRKPAEASSYPSAAETRAYVDTHYIQPRDWNRHDWRKTLIPKAAAMGLPGSCLRVCAALCSKQRGRDWFPAVIIGLDELAQLAGWKMYTDKRVDKVRGDRGNLRRAIRKLVTVGLIEVETGRGHLGNGRARADIYRLGPAVIGTVSKMTPWHGVENDTARQDRHGVENDTAVPLSVTNVTEGDRGKRTVGLMADTPQPTSRPASPAANLSARLRALKLRFQP